MTDKIPMQIRAQLDDFIAQVQDHLPDLLDGFYLFGSIALDNFHPEKSDIDFLAILKRQCTGDDIRILKSIHQDITNRYPKYGMDGSYLQKNDIGKLNHVLSPYPFFNGEMHTAGHYDINLVTWWILKNHGITVLGEDVQSLSFSVDWEKLITAMHENLNSYWNKWATSPEHFAYLLQDDAIEWAILGILRLYYSFRENAITSKSGAGEYALLHLPAKWHPLIEHALVLRNNRVISYKNRFIRQQDARQFLRYVIDDCNRMFRI